MKKIFTFLVVMLAVLTIAKAQQRGFVEVKVPQAANGDLYKYSYALVIGESNYTAGWQQLSGVKTDIQEVKTALEKQGFYVVLKQDLTSSQLVQAITDFIADYGQNIDSRILFYYAGHGHTISNQTTNQKMGYIVPVDAPNPYSDMSGFLKKAIPMNNFNTYALSFQSKHVLFMFDACFAGTVFSSRAGVPPAISSQTSLPVRQFITSGSADETVPDESVFRKLFVRALSSTIADGNNDGFLTATELGFYLQNEVINYNSGTQHPKFGKILNPDLDQGDFVFVLNQTTSPDPNVNNGQTTNATGTLTLITDYSGTVKITSATSGSLLQTKDVSAGGTYTFSSLPAGIVVINIYSGSQIVWTSKVSVPANSSTTVKAEKTTGSVQLVAEISGNLYIDETYKKSITAGNTYTINDLAAGNHAIRIDNNWQQTIYITAGQTSTIKAEKPAGTLQMTTSISGNFFIDEILREYLTSGTHTYAGIDPGSHTAKIVSSGQTIWTSNFTISANKTTTLNAQSQNNNSNNNNNTAGYEPEMVLVQGGTFQMGSNDGYDNEKPVHSVTVSDFYMGKYEITNEQYCAFLNDYGSDKVKSGDYSGQTMIVDSKTAFSGSYDWGVHLSGGKWYPASGYAKYPVIDVTWYGANEYCKWLSQKTGKTYSLPTEAEWEYAAKGGQSYTYAGSNNIDEVAWYDDNSGSKTHQVGTKSPNSLGLYDMSGNVWEWCNDWYGSDYYSSSPTNNPTGASSGSNRVFRGGSWYDYAGYCRVANRSLISPNSFSINLGFRAVCSF